LISDLPPKCKALSLALQAGNMSQYEDFRSMRVRTRSARSPPAVPPNEFSHHSALPISFVWSPPLREVKLSLLSYKALAINIRFDL
jgi:hypothetical protein